MHLSATRLLSVYRIAIFAEDVFELIHLIQGRRRRSGRTASAGPLFRPSMLSTVSLFLVSAHFTFYSDFIQSAKIH